MTTRPIIAPKKLIEVALPLEDINKACGREKSIRHGHPSTLHLWWARRPLAAARAVLFAQLVNDPSWKYSEAELQKPQVKSAITRKRNELFKLISEFVLWENSGNKELLSRAHAVIRESWRETCEANKDHTEPEVWKLFDPLVLPPFHDPFAGGGTIPLEAQRLGLEAHATDLNPVAVLINKAMLEIPSKFAGRPPVGPALEANKQTRAKATEEWSGARGLAEDVRRYGAWIREEAFKRIGHLYPTVKITKAMVKARPDLAAYEGRNLTVIAWLWARTVASPNPSLRGVQVPLVSSFWLAQKEGKEAWVEPVVVNNKVTFRVGRGKPKDPRKITEGTKPSKGSFVCCRTGTAITADYIKEEGVAGRLGAMMMAVVCEGDRERVYLAPLPEHITVAESVDKETGPDTPIPPKAIGFRVQAYGFRRYRELFAARQQVALSTLVQLLSGKLRARVRADAMHAGEIEQDAEARADAICVLLAMLLARCADFWSTLATWSPAAKNEIVGHTFTMQTVTMTWDYGEINPFSDSGGSLSTNLEYVAKAVENLAGTVTGFVEQAAAQTIDYARRIVSTDPPYYDNIGYADLSDYFYSWHRAALKTVLPDLFASIMTPKLEELVSSADRHGGKDAAEAFFLAQMKAALGQIALWAHPAFPATIYYAFKQSESDDMGTVSSGWETFLQAVSEAGLRVVGTWPLRTERGARTRGIGANALASSVVLVCRPRDDKAHSTARREFLRELDKLLPAALGEMIADPIAAIAPVDLAQAAIGPGMAIFSKYKSILEADGSSMTVHNALIHINKAVDDYFTQAEGDLDADTRFCIGWFQQYGFETGPFGEADVLARAKGTSVDGVRDAGVLSSAKGKVRLLKIKEYPKSWDPTKDDRTPIWEACHQMSRALGESEHEAGALLARMPDKQDPIRQLAYRLYILCERKGWADEARAYNELVTSWPAIVEESHKTGHKGTQLDLL